MAPSAEPQAPSGAALRRQRLWFWIGISTVVLALAFIAYWAVLLYWPPGVEQGYVMAYESSPDGLTLTVEYTSGRDCDEALWERVDESATAVVVDIAFRGFGRQEIHDDMARICRVEFSLESPLGDRPVTTTEGVVVQTSTLPDYG